MKLIVTYLCFTANLVDNNETMQCPRDLNTNQQSNGCLKTKPAELSDHFQFLITETGSTTPKTPKSPTSTEFEKESNEKFQLVADKPLISPITFCKVFPFHLMFDRKMRIVQAGKSVARVIPRVKEQLCPLLEILEPVRPHIQLTFQNILAHINTIYVLKTKDGTMLKQDTFLRLKVKFNLIYEVNSDFFPISSHVSPKYSTKVKKKLISFFFMISLITSDLNKHFY